MKQIAPWKVESKTLFRLSGAMNLCRRILIKTDI